MKNLALGTSSAFKNAPRGAIESAPFVRSPDRERAQLPSPLGTRLDIVETFPIIWQFFRIARSCL